MDGVTCTTSYPSPFDGRVPSSYPHSMSNTLVLYSLTAIPRACFVARSLTFPTIRAYRLRLLTLSRPGRLCLYLRVYLRLRYATSSTQHPTRRHSPSQRGARLSMLSDRDIFDYVRVRSSILPILCPLLQTSLSAEDVRRSAPDFARIQMI
jgi:hypothetical protein